MQYITRSKYRSWTKRVTFLLAAVLLTAAITVTAFATPTTITVMNTNDSGAGSLRQAIADAAPDDTIMFSVTGTITLTTGALGICKNLTIQGPGSSQLAISGDSTSRVFYVCESVTATLDGMTIRDGFAYDNGGGIRTYGTLTVKNSIITGNGSAGYDDGDGGQGGGISNWGTLTLINSTISNNSVWAYYGGYGGGILNGGTLTILNSTVSVNSSNYNGGGISNWGDVQVNSSTIYANNADRGGGIYNSGATLTILNSTVSGNLSNFDGGGIYCAS